MKAELIREFNLLQNSMAGDKYTEVLKEQLYQPLKDANSGVSTWITERGRMLMKMESGVSRAMRIVKRKFLKF